MKKLIALAVVAVAGAVVAADGYDFNATLKTTVGKSGKDSTETYYLGMNDQAKFWYEDANLPSNLTTKVINGITVPALVKDAKGYYVGDDVDKIIALADKLDPAKYNQKSAGRWCETVKVLTPAQCYRVAGTRKIQTKLWVDQCCGGQNAYTNGAAKIDYSGATGSAAKFLQFFGAQEPVNAKKVEIYAPAQNLPVVAGNLVPATFNGALAGQGTRDNVRVTSLSGNIVGAIDAPVCPNCCAAPVKALAFDCTAADTNLYTAAFGTFRMKYNRNY